MSDGTDPAPLPEGFVPWRATSTPPPDFWPEEREPEELDEETPPLDLWATVGDARPWGTALLVLSWCAAFAILGLRHEIGSSPAYVRWGGNLFPAGWSEPWRWLAYTFLHASIAHLFFNALAMAVMGPAVERIFTRSHFLFLFAGGGIASALASLAWRASLDRPGTSLSIGASGAIFAMGGALLSAAARLRKRLPPSRARALAGSLLPLLLQGLVAGFSRPGTDNAAHVAGLAWGLAFGAVLGLDPRLADRPIPAWSRLLGLASGVALAATFAYALWRGLGGA